MRRVRRRNPAVAMHSIKHRSRSLIYFFASEIKDAFTTNLLNRQGFFT
jgi:hypothetical protein